MLGLLSGCLTSCSGFCRSSHQQLWLGKWSQSMYCLFLPIPPLFWGILMLVGLNCPAPRLVPLLGLGLHQLLCCQSQPADNSISMESRWDRISESLRLKKTAKIIKSHCQPSPPCPLNRVPYPILCQISPLDTHIHLSQTAFVSETNLSALRRNVLIITQRRIITSKAVWSLLSLLFWLRSYFTSDWKSQKVSRMALNSGADSIY